MESEELSPFLESSRGHGGNIQDVSTVTFSRSLSSRRCWCAVIGIVAVILAIAAVFSAGILVGHFAITSKPCATSGNSSRNITEEICDDPPLLLVSLDGFRASYFHLNVTPNLHDLYTNGVRAKFMRSSFPTKTFPNHYSIVTGLYPESHGIVNNAFYDSQLNDTFYFTRRSSLQSKWWGGEPIWVTAAMNSLRTAAYFWPGSESSIKGIRPDTYENYDGSVPFSVRVETVMDWLDSPKEKRPKFIALYFNEPDHVGHKYGPESSEIVLALREVDWTIRLLMRELNKRNISDCVNIVITSDHGMAAYNSSLFVNLYQLIPSTLRGQIQYLPLGVVSNPVLSGDELTEEVYEAFVNGTERNAPFRVFKKEQLPLRLHSGQFNKQRYGPIYAIADVHATFGSGTYKPSLGDHGFDNIERDMQAIFLGHGPYFKKNYVAEGFENIQVYSLLCDLLNVTAAENNGSYGALHDLLDPTYAAKLGPAQSLPPQSGKLVQCPFPRDEEELLRRSICDGCVCRTDHCNVTDEDILMANKYLLDISSSTKSMFEQYHHPWGVPSGGYGAGACVLSQLGYVSLYSGTLNTPLWSGYTLDPQFVDGNVSEDHWCWRNDPRLPLSASPNCSTDLELEQSNSTHIPAPLLFPMDSSVNTSLSMSLLTNVVYMDRGFRSGLWQLVMSRIRAWFKTYNTPMNIIIGVVLDSNRDGVRDRDFDYTNKFMGVTVPTHFYVVVTRCSVRGVSLSSCSVKDLRVLGLVLQHPKEPGDYAEDEKVLHYSVTPVRDIERATGVDFFPNLSPADQNTLELSLLNELWSVS